MTLQEAKHFVGPKVSILLALGVLGGLLFFVTDISFAYALQAFLVAIGIMASASAQFPHWIPHSNFIAVLSFVVSLGILRGSIVGLQLYLQGVTSGEFRYLQRARIIKNALHSPSASTAELTALFNARSESAGTAIANLSVLGVQLTTAIPLGASLLYLAPWLTCAGAALLFLSVMPLQAADRRLQSVGQGLVVEWNKAHNKLLQGIRNLLLLRIYGTQSQEEAKAQHSLSEFRRHMLAYYRAHGFRNAAPQVVGIVLLCAMTIIVRRTGQMSAGLLLSYFYLFLRFVQAVAAVNQGITGFRLDRPQIDALLNWWRSACVGTPPEAAPALHAVDFPESAPIGWLMSKVRFGYPSAQKPVFSRLDIEITPGEAVMITGVSGSGKSTLLYLLLGIVEPQEGAIEILSPGAKPRRLADCRAALLNVVGYVGPDSFLDEGSVLENLTYGLKHTPSQAEIRSALETAECRFVFNLPNGLDHKLTEQGQGLSAGQQQRLCLARALLRRPKVLILDEATSNLDAETEEKLLDTLAGLKGRMTIIAATHRPAFQRMADRSFNLDAAENSLSEVTAVPSAL